MGGRLEFARKRKQLPPSMCLLVRLECLVALPTECVRWASVELQDRGRRVEYEFDLGG